MKYHHYFAYGSNMDFAQMKKRCPSALIVDRAAILPHHKLAFDIYSPKRKSGCADIVTSKKDIVAGVVYKVSTDDMRAMDRFEGHPIHYKRTLVEVKTSENKLLKCFSYEVVDKQKNLKPTKKYLSKIVRASKRYDFPERYNQYLASVKTLD